MKICLCQTAPQWEAPEANIEAAEKLIGRIEHCDLIVLPEMWATGFSVKEPQNFPKALEWMKGVAQQKNCAVAGSLAVKEEKDERWHNRLYFVRPDGTFEIYDKYHLFCYGEEHEHFQRGEKRVIVEWKGHKILLCTCFDLRFPVFLRNRGDYDTLLCVAAWPKSRIKAWNILMAARAVENQCFAIGVNRTGKEPRLTYCGNSGIWHPDGSVLLDSQSEEKAVILDLDYEELERFRRKFPFYKEADAFHLDSI